jgi:2-oxoglutarate dehydrogenase E1 component
VTGTSAPAAPAPTAPTAPAAPAAAAIPAAGTSTDGDAAAKHAKRTACLKDAKAQKLVGAKKTAFVKDCVAGP